MIQSVSSANTACSTAERMADGDASTGLRGIARERFADAAAASVATSLIHANVQVARDTSGRFAAVQADLVARAAARNAVDTVAAVTINRPDADLEERRPPGRGSSNSPA